MQPIRIPYDATGRYAPIVLDHLSGAGGILEFRTHPPTLEGLRAAATERTFDADTRAVLVAALRRQYGDIVLTSAVRDNLAALERSDALTVVTGHQLCLFGGPMYLPFKILNVVRLARQLTDALHRPVVPVFWMASEDHDREEIDHVWMGATRVRWPGRAGGAVGRMPLTDIDAVLRALEPHLGTGDHADALRDLLYACYRPDRTLADATRRFIHGLFGRFGLLIIDGDDAALKQLVTPLFRTELLDNVAQRAVAYADERLGARYGVQAHVREVNLFHLRKGHRSRIVLEDDNFRVLDNGPVLGLDELLRSVEQRPEEFSPNVLLRPVYQETILPNIAYVGGGGELAYWLQLRWLFQAVRVPMPVVLLRTSAGFISSKHMQQWKGMGLGLEELFADADQVKARVAARDAGFSTTVEVERGTLAAFYAALADKAAAADDTLRASVEARAKAADKGMVRIGKSLVRAAKRKEAVTLQRIDAVQAAMFPLGGLQERRASILPLLAVHGVSFLDELLAHLDPLQPCFTVLVEG